MNKVTYKKSNKKIYILSATYAAIIIGFAFLPMLMGSKPPLSTIHTYLLAALIAVLGYSWLKGIKKAQDAKCPHCGIELFYVIESAYYQKTPINYCVSCGKEIEI